MQVGTRHLERRYETEGDACRDGDGQRVQDDPGVGAHTNDQRSAVPEARARQRRLNRSQERSQHPGRNHQTNGRRDGGDEDALGEKLPDESSTTRAERESNGDLSLARRGASEEQSSDVGARYEKDECNRGLNG